MNNDNKYLIGCNYWASNLGIYMWRGYDKEVIPYVSSTSNFTSGISFFVSFTFSSSGTFTTSCFTTGFSFLTSTNFA